MKKILFILFIAILAFSCSNDPISNDNLEIQNTAWSRDTTVFKNDQILFFENGKCNYSYSTSNAHRSYDMVYSYNKPNVTMTFSDKSVFGIGKITGNKLYIEGWGTFTRYQY